MLSSKVLSGDRRWPVAFRRSPTDQIFPMSKILALLVLAHWLYDGECCEQRHCHPVPCEQISDTGAGWIWHTDKEAVNFSRDMLKVSPDGNCHVCVSHLTNTPVVHGICIYLPARSDRLMEFTL
jgi:hypothetical protein